MFFTRLPHNLDKLIERCVYSLFCLQMQQHQHDWATRGFVTNAITSLNPDCFGLTDVIRTTDCSHSVGQSLSPACHQTPLKQKNSNIKDHSCEVHELIRKQRSQPSINTDLDAAPFFQTVVPAVTLFVPTWTADTRGQRQQETRAETKQCLWRGWPHSPLNHKLLPLQASFDLWTLSFHHCVRWHLQPPCNQWFSSNNYRSLLSGAAAWDADVNPGVQASETSVSHPDRTVETNCTVASVTAWGKSIRDWAEWSTFLIVGLTSVADCVSGPPSVFTVVLTLSPRAFPSIIPSLSFQLRQQFFCKSLKWGELCDLLLWCVTFCEMKFVAEGATCQNVTFRIFTPHN